MSPDPLQPPPAQQQRASAGHQTPPPQRQQTAADRQLPPSQRLHCHLLLCATPSKALCQPDPSIGAASWERLKQLIRDLRLDDPQRPEGMVWRSKVDCLRICHDGPVLLIWPDGTLYGGVTPERIERIVREHVLGGEPLEDWILERCSLAGSAAELRSAPPITGAPVTDAQVTDAQFTGAPVRGAAGS